MLKRIHYLINALFVLTMSVRSYKVQWKSFLSRTKYQQTSTTMKATETLALLFDCDGVIVETEELHRLAYNKAFSSFGLVLPNGKPVEWDIAYYDILQNTVGGGKPKMNYYFNEEVKAWPLSTNPKRPAPTTPEEKSRLVDELQDAKTEFYIKIVEEVASARPGVLSFIDAALSDKNLKVGICSAATKAGFEKIVNTIVGKDRLDRMDVVIAGDDVQVKNNRIHLLSFSCLLFNLTLSHSLYLRLEYQFPLFCPYLS